MGIAEGLQVGDHKDVDDQHNFPENGLQRTQRLDFDEDWDGCYRQFPHHICNFPVGKGVASIQEAIFLDD